MALDSDILSPLVRAIPDFPKPGILFRDITPILSEGEVFARLVDDLADRYREAGLTKIVGVESRGFLFGTGLATRLNLGFVPARKPGKLPADTFKQSYSLEYGEDTLEMHKDALNARDKVLVVDDLLATGGTARAACELAAQAGAEIHGVWVLIELAALQGRSRLQPFELDATLVYED